MDDKTLSFGGFSLNIVSLIPESLCCLLCYKILENPHLAPCGCRFCLNCMEHYLKKNSRICPGESEKCSEVSLEMDRDLKYDVFANREISKMKVKCPLYICDQECEYREMKVHLPQCALTSVICDLCNENMVRREYENHNQLFCKEDIGICQFCKKMMLRKDLLENHLNYECDNVCNQYQDYCPNECEEKNKILWVNHRRTCIPKKVECPYKNLGCDTDQMTMKEMSKHMEKNNLDHVEQFSKQFLQLRVENEHLKEEIGNIKNEMTLLRNNVKENESEMKDCHNPKIKNQEKEEDKETNLQMILKLQDEIKNHISDYTKLRKEMKMIENEMDSLKRKCKTIPQLNLIKESKTKHSDLLLIWNVDDFLLNHNFHSPPFYTHRKGYKMRIKLIKAVKGFLSLYVQICCGEYDQKLQWPIRKRLIVRLVDQDGRGRDLEKKIFFDVRRGYIWDRFYGDEFGELKIHQFISYEELYQTSYLLSRNKLLFHCFADDNLD